jgi:K+-sensing histidine kinase KdpD
VEVADAGKGLTAEEIDKLFKIFGTIKRTEEVNQDGIGMGLLICQKIV